MFGRKRRERREKERRAEFLRGWDWHQAAWQWQRQNPGVPLMRGIITQDASVIVWNGPEPGYRPDPAYFEQMSAEHDFNMPHFVNQPGVRGCPPNCPARRPDEIWRGGPK